MAPPCELSDDEEIVFKSGVHQQQSNHEYQIEIEMKEKNELKNDSSVPSIEQEIACQNDECIEPELIMNRCIRDSKEIEDIVPQKLVIQGDTCESTNVNLLAEQREDCYQYTQSFKAQISSTLAGFSNTTSIHGPKRILKARGRTSRAGWTFVFIGVVSLAVYLIAGVVVKYYSYPIEDGISIKTQSLAFPSVTLCPLIPNDDFLVMSDLEAYWQSNQGDKYLLYTLKAYKYLIGKDRLVSDIRTDFPKNESSFSNALIQSWLDLSSWLSEKLSPVSRWQVENFPLNDININVSEIGPTKGLSSDDINVAGMDPVKEQDFILECVYNDKPCDEQFNVTKVTTAYGQCFTLNISESAEDVNEIGPNKGLTLILYTGRYNPIPIRPNFYMPTMGFSSTYAQPSDGVQIVVHNPGTMPQPYREGFHVTPGRLTSVKITKTERTRLVPPYGDCTDKDYLVNSEFRYSYEMCVEQCLQERIIQKCGCVSPMYIIPADHNFSLIQYCGNISKIFGFSENKNCIHSNSWMTRGSMCLYGTPQLRLRMINLANDIIDRLKCEQYWSKSSIQSCKCRRPCKENTYIHLINTIPWPEKSVVSNDGQRGFLKFRQKHKNIDKTFKLFERELRLYTYLWDHQFEVFEDCFDHNITDGHKQYNINSLIENIVDTNFLKLNIHIESLDVRTVYEERTYTYDNVMKDIGNVFGFYLGMSAVSVVEGVYIIGVLIKLIIYRMMCRRN
ncbi:unnamed protein product [Owenia fusiformis]|uniref:Uncharacterized protein n=1 Tax=Owenia fusiformis TaxID=6347 RepID=A0A8J1UFF0_OWEFU|nr:unnamed protein product [Owenia fusiformis]